MVGLIWFVQVVHYPLFGRVGDAAFVAYEREHTNLTGYVVIPFMLLELASALYLLADRPAWMPLTAAWASLVLVGVAWLSTFALSVPQHEVLMGGFDARAHGLLVATNWFRTGAWTARGVLLGVVALLALGSREG
jgi:hypothetical protein